ncbi:hypothetical protein T492DRAFT_884069 [Pavlovales sp. CCMP2436]|nr:hypothetical protein T492DRAFT_884069 [Pavlovales sp. CCMP2436]
MNTLKDFGAALPELNAEPAEVIIARARMENFGGGGTAHFGADNDDTEAWAEGAYHQRQETRSWHEAA